MIKNIKGYKVIAPKEFFAKIKEVVNISFDRDTKGSEWWFENAMYEVTYKKGDTIKFDKMLTY